MVFGFVISITSVAEWQVKGVEFKTLGSVTPVHTLWLLRAHKHSWSPPSPVSEPPTVERWGIRNEWAEKIITALSALTGRRALWLPYKQFARLIDWHKMAAGLRLNSGLSWGHISCRCNKHNSADVIDPSNYFLYYKQDFIKFTTLELLSREAPEGQSCNYY